MRIGIDLDDTICATTEIVHDRVEKYASIEHLNSLDIMNDEVLREGFFRIYLEDIYSNVEIKKEAANVLKRLKTRGNEIYIITARSSNIVPTVKNVKKITEEWLKRHGIEVDDIIIAAYGEKKAEMCKKYKIELMIDDDPYNLKKVMAHGINYLLFDDREKYDLKENYVTNWQQVEKYIERNR